MAINATDNISRASIARFENRIKKSATNPAFGCRMMAFMAPNGGDFTDRDTFIKSCLVNADNSLKNQAKANRSPRDGFTLPFHLEDLSGTQKKYGNPDGWGFVDYVKGKLSGSDLRGIDPAEKSDTFNKTAGDIASKQPEIVFAHIRLASDKNSLSIKNTHPFTVENWSFMHNGSIGIKKSEILLKRLKEYETKYGLKLNGTTDSEKSFKYFIGKMKDKGLDINSPDLNPTEARNIFAEAIDEIKNNTQRKTSKLDGSIMGVVGEIQKPPAMNFITTNGKMVLAYRYGAKLYLGLHKLPDNKNEYLFASEPMQPSDNPKAIQWLEIPQDYLLTLTEAKNGTITPVLMPLWRALEIAKYPSKANNKHTNTSTRF